MLKRFQKKLRFLQGFIQRERVQWCAPDCTKRGSHLNFFLIILLCLVNQSVFAQTLPESSTRIWLKQNLNFPLTKITENISPKDASPGAVIAARTRVHPNYYYHWVRDAGLTIDSLVNVYQSTTNQQQKEMISSKIFQYLDFSTKIQNIRTLAGLGEPKFNVDGSAFNDPWSRPQNDGPALRAISLMHWGKILISEGKESVVREKMYDSKLPAKLPIKMDLEYVSSHWQDPTFDIWEEVKGTHFYTLMVERRAMLEGAAFANRLGDTGAAQWYLKQGKAIEVVLQKFWDAQQGFIIPTINRVGGLDYKYSNVDSAVILGLLHGDMNDGFFSWEDARVQKTIEKVIYSFSEIYPINRRAGIPGIAIGRYPEDRYAGVDFSGGNPWPLCTLAIAEAFYRYANWLFDRGDTKKAVEIANRADQFVERIRYHAHPDGSLNEQINRYTGYMTSVSDLTWNYAALLSTRNAVLK